MIPVARDLKTNLRWRLFVLRKARGNKLIQKALKEQCKNDFSFYVNTMVYQTNPNKEDDSAGPFVMWPFQDRAVLSQDEEKPGILACISRGVSLVIEKSRDMGATWLVLIVKDWKCRFKPYYDSLMMSKSAQAVDSASRQSLFGKLRFIHEHLPKYLHDTDKFLDNKNTFIYPGTNATQTGYSSTGKAGVSERGADFFVDEYTQIEEDWEVLHRTVATSKCRIFVATHMGLGTAFYSLTQNPHFKKIQFHWTQHPAKNKGLYRWDSINNKIEFLKYNEETDEIEVCENQYEYPKDFEFDMTGRPVGGPHPGVRSPWYDHTFREMGESESEMAKDYDINPSGSVSQFYNPLVIRDVLSLCRPPQEYELEYTKEGVPTRLVPTVDGRVKLWCPIDGQGRPARGVYGAGTDISGGTGCTPSCLSIVSGKTGEKVMELMDPNMDPKEFAVFCVAMCRLFCDVDGEGAKIAWENHGPGVTFGVKLYRDLRYLRVYYGENFYTKTQSPEPGWNPIKANRLKAHADYKQALYERKYVNRSKHALVETLNFKHDGSGSVEHTQYVNKNNPAGGRENHGDVVVADMLGNMIVKDVLRVIEKAELLAQPGTLQYLFDQEALGKSRAGELYPNWNRRG